MTDHAELIDTLDDFVARLRKEADALSDSPLDFDDTVNFLHGAANRLVALVAERDALRVQFDKCWTVLDDINMCVGNEGGNLTWPAIDLIPEQIERISRIVGQAAIGHNALVAERDRYREALEEIAKQVPAKDMDEDYYEAADFEDGYDRCIFAARAALAQGGEP